VRDAAGGAGERAPWRPCDVPLASRWPLWSPLPRPPPVPGVLAGTYLKRIKAKYYRVGRPVYTKLDLAQQVRDDCTASTYDRPQAQEELTPGPGELPGIPADATLLRCPHPGPGKPGTCRDSDPDPMVLSAHRQARPGAAERASSAMDRSPSPRSLAGVARDPSGVALYTRIPALPTMSLAWPQRRRVERVGRFHGANDNDRHRTPRRRCGTCVGPEASASLRSWPLTGTSRAVNRMGARAGRVAG
jgi:hypothetical protein